MTVKLAPDAICCVMSNVHCPFAIGSMKMLYPADKLYSPSFLQLKINILDKFIQVVTNASG